MIVQRSNDTLTTTIRFNVKMWHFVKYNTHTDKPDKGLFDNCYLGTQDKSPITKCGLVFKGLVSSFFYSIFWQIWCLVIWYSSFYSCHKRIKYTNSRWRQTFTKNDRLFAQEDLDFYSRMLYLQKYLWVKNTGLNQVSALWCHATYEMQNKTRQKHSKTLHKTPLYFMSWMINVTKNTFCKLYWTLLSLIFRDK